MSKWPTGLSVLLVLDGLLLGAYILLWLKGGLRSIPELNLGQDSIQEQFSYLKWFACGLMGLWLFARSRQLLYLAWAGLFLCFFVEDLESFRDPVGGWIASAMGWSPAAGLTEQGLGEIAASLVGSAVLLGAVAVVHSRSNDSEAKSFSRDLAPLLGALIIFGVGVDALHAMVGQLAIPDFALGVVEEGGEMIIASMLTIAFYVQAFPFDRAISDASAPTDVVDEESSEVRPLSG